MSETGYVYTLNDPRTGEPKYVGATKNPRTRLYGHEHGATNDDVTEWINELEQASLSPEMTLVEVTSLDDLSDAEQQVIARLSEEWELLNGEYSTPYQSQNNEPSGMSKTIVVHNQVHNEARELANDRDITIKEAVRDVFKEAGYDV